MVYESPYSLVLKRMVIFTIRIVGSQFERILIIIIYCPEPQKA